MARLLALPSDRPLSAPHPLPSCASVPFPPAPSPALWFLHPFIPALSPSGFSACREDLAGSRKICRTCEQPWSQLFRGAVTPSCSVPSHFDQTVSVSNTGY